MANLIHLGIRGGSGGGGSGGGGGGATASTSPQGGVVYTNGTSGLDSATLNIFARAISSNADISSATSLVYVDYGNEHRKIAVGNQVTIAVNGTNYAFDIIGFNHDTLTHSNIYGEDTATGKAGITLQMHDIFATTYPINSGNTSAGGWNICNMRVSTMVTMRDYLPTEWQGIIKPVNKYTLGTSTAITVDECFLLSETEVLGYVRWSLGAEGIQYAYYAAGNSKDKLRAGSSYSWWERSPKSGEYPWCYIQSGGTPNGGNAANENIGVAFAFCV